MVSSGENQEHVAANGADTRGTHTEPDNPPTGTSGNSTISDSKDSLRKFKTIVGIGTPTKITSVRNDSNSTWSIFKFKFNRPPANTGIYQRIVDLQWNRQWTYMACTYLINSCLLAQIAFA